MRPPSPGSPSYRGSGRPRPGSAAHRPIAPRTARWPLEAEYFGGIGTQGAQVWDGGTVVLGPLHLAEGEPFPPGGSPISRALRRLGTVKHGHLDEFDAVGLGRHRVTDEWLSPTS